MMKDRDGLVLALRALEGFDACPEICSYECEPIDEQGDPTGGEENKEACTLRAKGDLKNREELIDILLRHLDDIEIDDLVRRIRGELGSNALPLVCKR